MSVSVQVAGGAAGEGGTDLAGVAARLSGKDATLWGSAAQPEAAQRLGWLDLPRSSEALLPQLRDLRERNRVDGLDHVVLAGMGGSSLAPEVITRTAGADLTILDSTDPHQVARVLGDRIERTVLVVASKSGGTIETDSHRRAFEEAFRSAGLTEAVVARRIVVVTDPGSPLDKQARDAGYEVVLADPSVGGRYSALSAFGLTPSFLAGADVERLLADARVLAGQLGDDDNPGIALGRAMGELALAGRDKLVIADSDTGGSRIVGFGDWAEQLVAESTGKDGKGILPVVVEGTGAAGFRDAGDDAHLVVLGPGRPGFDATSVSGSLGAQFLLWEYATAVAGVVLGINPFDQPNVAESKENTARLLEQAGDGPLPAGEPAFTDGAVEVHADAELLGEAADLAAVLDALLRALPPRGYLAVMAYLDRDADAAAAALRDELALRTAHPVTFGWGPRFLHSTGQYHKGGPQTGVFLQITGAGATDVPVPGRPFTLGRLQLAQALGDLGALRRRERPAVRLHLRDRRAGLRELLAAAGGLGKGAGK